MRGAPLKIPDTIGNYILSNWLASVLPKEKDFGGEKNFVWGKVLNDHSRRMRALSPVRHLSVFFSKTFFQRKSEAVHL